MDWATWNHTPAPRREPPDPERSATLFRVVGTSGRTIRCASYRTPVGVELRCGYEDRPEDILRTQLFKPYEAEALAEVAAAWHGAFDAVGTFKQLAILD